MNDDQIKGAWRQIEGEARRRWGKLTNHDWSAATGSLEKLAGRIQQRYGDAKESIAKELDRIAAGIRGNTRTTKRQHDVSETTIRPVIRPTIDLKEKRRARPPAPQVRKASPRSRKSS